MATQFKQVTSEQPTAETLPYKPHLVLVHDSGSYEDLKRHVAGFASRGVHPRVHGILVGCYAAMLLSFWAIFGRDGPTDLELTVVTILMIMYFSLLVGGIILADSPAEDHQRSFREFMRGHVNIATGIISGREAVMQILLLPGLMLMMIIMIGIIIRT